VNTLTFLLDSVGLTGATIDPSTGVFSWTPDNTIATGSYNALIRVTDDGTPSLFATGSFTILVTKAPDPIVGACGTDSGATLANNPSNLCAT